VYYADGPVNLYQLRQWYEPLKALDAEAPKAYTQLDYRGPVALVFGGEGKGVRPGVRGTCDDAAHIPMLGKVSSLNVSASAAIVLYEALRQRRERAGERP
jgi:23S rRNA (guanosine2251-2'-O)-methyltransferase